MHQRKSIPRILSAAALALLFGSGAVFADEDKAGQSGASQSGQTSAGAEESSGSAATSTASGQSAQAGDATLSKRDRDIMRELARANLAEIETGKIALERSQNPEVRQFAQRMIDDHTQSQQQLKQLADAKDVQLPTEPARKHQRLANKLSGLEGEQFDKTYRREVGEQAHEQTHKLLSRAQKNAQDPELRALVGETLPVVSQHLDLAENLEEQRSQTSGGAASGQAGDDDDAAGASVGSSAPTGASGASMTPESSGAAASSSADTSDATTGAESVSGTSGQPQMRGPGKQ